MAENGPSKKARPIKRSMNHVVQKCFRALEEFSRNGDSFCNPNPHIQGKNMNKYMAPKLGVLYTAVLKMVKG